MPHGIGRGDGDQGSAPNLHIGYFEMQDGGGKGNFGKGNLKPYLRTSEKGKKVRNGEDFENYEIRRYFLTPVSDAMDRQLTLIEQHCADEKYSPEVQKLIDQTNPYIKIAIITDGGTSSSNNLVPF